MASPAVTDAIMYDDIALMRLGQAWIKNMLFGQEMPPGEAIIEA